MRLTNEQSSAAIPIDPGTLGGESFGWAINSAGAVVRPNGIVLGGQSYVPPDSSNTMKTTLVRYVQ